MLAMYSVTARVTFGVSRGREQFVGPSPLEAQAQALEDFFYDTGQDLQFSSVTDLARTLSVEGFALKPYSPQEKNEVVQRIRNVDSRRLPLNSSYDIYEVDSLRVGRNPQGIADLVVQQI